MLGFARIQPIMEVAGGTSEAELVLRVQAGDAQAFETLIGMHAGRVYRTLVRVLGSQTDAEDVLQETFIKAWRALPRFRGEAQLSTWLYRIAMNEASRHRSAGARHQALPLDDTVVEVADISPGPPALAESAELRARLELFIRELPQPYREAVVLRDIEGLTNEEAADVLGLDIRNFKSRLHRGRMALRKRLEALHEQEQLVGGPSVG